MGTSNLRFLIICFLLVFQCCQCNNEKTSSKFEISDSIRDFSFVVSCGSGCALTYNFNKIERNEKSITIKFKVEMYVNEETIDVYYETYRFKTEPDKLIEDESGKELSNDIHPKLLNELKKVFDYFE